MTLTKDFKHTKLLLLAAGIFSAINLFPIHNVFAETSSEQSSFTAEQKTEIEALFKKFIGDNPELILNSVRTHQENQEKKMAQTAQEKLVEYQAIFAQKDLPMAGNSNGDVTVVEFFDYNCGYCKKAFEDIQKILGEDSNLRFVFQEMPILSPSSAKMSALALAAHKQGKYFEMHKALMEYRGTQSDEAFLNLAKDLGLDVEKLKKDSESTEIQDEISNARNIAQTIGIRGTPGFIISDKIYPGYIGADGITDAIKDARKTK